MMRIVPSSGAGGGCRARVMCVALWGVIRKGRREEEKGQTRDKRRVERRRDVSGLE